MRSSIGPCAFGGRGGAALALCALDFDVFACGSRVVQLFGENRERTDLLCVLALDALADLPFAAVLGAKYPLAFSERLRRLFCRATRSRSAVSSMSR